MAIDVEGGSQVQLTATFSVVFEKTFSDVTNVPSGNSSSSTKTVNSSSPGTVSLGVTLSSAVPVRDGYTFVGWRRSRTDSTDTLYSPGQYVSARVAYGDTTIYYMYSWWSIKTNTITYYANGGSGAPAAQTKNYGASINLSTTVPTRTGYIFVKWNTAANGSGTNYTGGQAYSANADLNLYAVWKAAASVPTLNKTTADIGTNVVISTNRADNSATHKLTFSFEGTSGDIASNVGASHTWTVGSGFDFYNLLPTKTSGTLTIYCETYINNTKSGDTQSVTLTVTVPASVKPTMTVSSSAVNEGNMSAILGTTVVQSLSKISFALSCTAGNGASFSSYSVTGQDLPSNMNLTQASTTIVTNIISGSGNLSWSFYVTDSRGRNSDTVTVTKNVSSYSRPSVSPISVYRCNSSGTADQSGGTYFNARCFYSAQNVGSNTITSAKVYYRKASSSGSSSWTQAADLTSRTDHGSGAWTGALGGGNIQLDYSYEIKFEVQDSVGAANSSALVTSISYPMPSSTGISYGIYNDRMRLGGLVNEAGFVVDWASKFNNTITIQNTSALGVTGMIVGEGDNMSLLLTGNK